MVRIGGLCACVFDHVRSPSTITGQGRDARSDVLGTRLRCQWLG